MIAARFKSVGLVAGVAIAALGCYIVSLKVASERGKLEEVERRILTARLDIRQLRTELGTRTRLTQLDRWNVDVLGLRAPGADQYVEGAIQLASLGDPRTPAEIMNPAAPRGLDNPAQVIQASATVPAARPAAPPVTVVAAATPNPPMLPVAQSVLRQATYIKPAEDRASGVRKVALLDEGALSDIARAAVLEAVEVKRPR